MTPIIFQQNAILGRSQRNILRRCGLAVFFGTVALLLSACGGGGGGSVPASGGSGSTPAATAPPAPTATIGFDVKLLTFSWPAVTGADYYQLLENADGGSGFSVIQNNITTTSTSKTISVVNHDWTNALYMVAACNSTGCTDSTTLTTLGSILKAIGFVKASNTGAGDQFSAQNGYGFLTTPPIGNSPAIALSGDGQTLVVGSSYEDSPDRGISTNQILPDDGTAVATGAVYVFRHAAGGWSQQAYIKASDAGGARLQFGFIVALNQDGNTLAVSDRGNSSTKVYLFRFSGAAWSEQTGLPMPVSYDSTVNSLALDDSGNILFVGKPFTPSGTILRAGNVAVYRYTSGAWGPAQNVSATAPPPLTDAHLGMSLSASGDGNTFVTGANGVTVSGQSNAGAAYVFRYNSATSSWTQEMLLQASNPDANDDFGRAVAISRDGITIAVGATNEDGAGTGVSNNGTGDTANAKANAGAVYVYRFAGTWGQKAYIKSKYTTTDKLFGSSLALSRDGTRLVAEEQTGAYQYQYDTTTSTWDTANIIVIRPVLAHFRSIALSDDGNTFAMANDKNDSNATGVTTADDPVTADTSAPNSGAVYLY